MTDQEKEHRIQKFRGLLTRSGAWLEACSWDEHGGVIAFSQGERDIGGRMLNGHVVRVIVPGTGSPESKVLSPENSALSTQHSALMEERMRIACEWSIARAKAFKAGIELIEERVRSE